jgi:hypothetical protein
MRVRKGSTIKQLIDQISHLRPEHKASAQERAKARAQLMKRCPYLFMKPGKAKKA